MSTIDTEVQRLVKAEINQEEAARVERIKQQVLERRAAEQAKNEREARIARLRTDIAQQLDPAPIDAAETELRQALEKYMVVCVAHDRRFSALWMDITNLAGSGAVPADMSASYTAISSGGKDWRKSRLHTRLLRAARAALEKAQPLDHVDLSRNPQD